MINLLTQARGTISTLQIKNRKLEEQIEELNRQLTASAAGRVNADKANAVANAMVAERERVVSVQGEQIKALTHAFTSLKADDGVQASEVYTELLAKLSALPTFQPAKSWHFSFQRDGDGRLVSLDAQSDRG